MISKGLAFLYQVMFGKGIPTASQGSVIGEPYSPNVSGRKFEVNDGFSKGKKRWRVKVGPQRLKNFFEIF